MKINMTTSRWQKCRDILAMEKCAAAFFTDRATVRYLTGFTGDDAALATVGDKKYLITDRRFIAEASLADATTVMHKNGLAPAAVKIFQRHKIKTVAVAPANLTLKQADGLREAKIKLTPLPRRFYALRQAKDEGEIAAMRAAIAAAETAFRHLLPKLRGQMTELDIKAELEFLLTRAGATSTSFPTIIASGDHAALPHAMPSRRVWQVGEPLVVDFGAVVEGYVSDLTRTLFWRQMSKAWRTRYDAVLAAQAAGIAAISAGKSGATAHRAARKILRERALAKFFTHGLGHGIGLEIHEEPRLSARARDPLPENCVVTVEPGIYLAGVGGIRIEDDVLVTVDGARVLSSLAKDPQSAVVG